MTESRPRVRAWMIWTVLGTGAVLLWGCWVLLFTTKKLGTATDFGISETAPSQSDYKIARLLSDVSGSISDKIVPSLVRITVTRPVGVARDKELESYFGQLPVPIGTDIGSGFFFQPGGWILTNYHVVRGADTIQIDGTNGRNWLAKMHAYDALSDISILKIEETEMAALEWGDARRIKVGNFVWIAGSPFGLDASVSFGIVSSLERRSMNGSPLRDYIQTDAAINPGNSGGPMLDVEGKVVGIVTSIQGDENRGIGFALNGDVAQSVAQQLIVNRIVNRGWIGVQLGQVTPEIAKKANLNSAVGAVIEWIDPGDESRIPARKAGIMAGDICVKCDALKILSQFDLARKIGMTPPGSSLTLELIRNSKSVVVSVYVMAKP